MPFQRYRKITPIYGRTLTEADYEVYHGVIMTNEGPRPFLPGDFLACDTLGQWPILVEQLRAHYARLDADELVPGFARYQVLDTREAMQMDEPFTVYGLTGQPGDYLVRDKNWSWPVERESFELSYTLVEEK